MGDDNSTSICNAKDFFNKSMTNVTTCSATSFSEEEIFAMVWMTTINGILSCLGAFFIIVTFIVFRDLRVPSLKLVMYLSITDLLSSVVYTLSSVETHNRTTCELFPACYVQAGLTEFAEMASFFWVGCIAFNIYSIAVLRQNEKAVNQQHLYYHIISWGIPAVLTVIGFAGEFYGPTGAWCWVDAEHTVARVTLLYMWLLLVLVIITYLYCHVAFAVRGSALSLIIGRLRLYVFIFIGAHIFGLANRIQNIIDPCKPVYWLSMVQACLASLQGLANAIAYGVNRSVINEYKRCWRERSIRAEHRLSLTEESDMAARASRKLHLSLAQRHRPTTGLISSQSPHSTPEGSVGSGSGGRGSSSGGGTDVLDLSAEDRADNSSLSRYMSHDFDYSDDDDETQ